MLSMLVRWVLFAGALLFSAWVVPGISFAGYPTAFFAALVMGLVNIFIRPILFLLTLPVNILTLGLFTLVINALMLLLIAKLVVGFVITGFWAAFFGALVLAFLSLFINRIDF